MRTYAKGDMVQMTRWGLRKQYKGANRPKTEDTRGIFVRYDGGSFSNGKRPRAVIHWLTGEHFPPHYEQVTRLDYIEPHGTPR